MIGYKINEEGLFTQAVYLNDSSSDSYIVEHSWVDEGKQIFIPKWNGSEWIEAATEEEIDAIQNHPAPIDPLKALGEQLAQEKLKNMQLNSQVSNLGQQLAMVKLDVMKIKGGQSA